MKFILYFGASWCGACRKLKPVIQKIANDEGIELIEYMAENDVDIFREYNVAALPTIIVKDKSGEVGRLSGLAKIEDIKELINKGGK